MFSNPSQPRPQIVLNMLTWFPKPHFQPRTHKYTITRPQVEKILPFVITNDHVTALQTLLDWNGYKNENDGIPHDIIEIEDASYNGEGAIQVSIYPSESYAVHLRLYGDSDIVIREIRL